MALAIDATTGAKRLRWTKVFTSATSRADRPPRPGSKPPPHRDPAMPPIARCPRRRRRCDPRTAGREDPRPAIGSSASDSLTTIACVSPGIRVRPRSNGIRMVVKKRRIDAVDVNVHRMSGGLGHDHGLAAAERRRGRQRHGLDTRKRSGAALQRVQICPRGSRARAVVCQTGVHRDDLLVVEARMHGHHVVERTDEQSRHDEQHAARRDLRADQRLPQDAWHDGDGGRPAMPVQPEERSRP